MTQANGVLQVTAFFDMVKDRPDEIATWWKRKAASMMEGGTSLVPYAAMLLGSFFEAEGATVRYAAATDNDPTMAAYANLDDAAVLRCTEGANSLLRPWSFLILAHTSA